MECIVRIVICSLTDYAFFIKLYHIAVSDIGVGTTRMISCFSADEEMSENWR